MAGAHEAGHETDSVQPCPLSSRLPHTVIPHETGERAPRAEEGPAVARVRLASLRKSPARGRGPRRALGPEVTGARKTGPPGTWLWVRRGRFAPVMTDARETPGVTCVRPGHGEKIERARGFSPHESARGASRHVETRSSQGDGTRSFAKHGSSQALPCAHFAIWGSSQALPRVRFVIWGSSQGSEERDVAIRGSSQREPTTRAETRPVSQGEKHPGLRRARFRKARTATD